jgi:hypothetical protein
MSVLDVSGSDGPTNRRNAVINRTISSLHAAQNGLKAVFRTTSTAGGLESLISRQLRRHFSKTIQMTPRAHHALMCGSVMDGQQNPDKFTDFGEEQILDRLMAASPALAIPLERADIAIDQLQFWHTYANEYGYPRRNLFGRLFPKGSPLWDVVSKSGYVNEHLLFRGIIELSIRKPFSFSRSRLRDAWQYESSTNKLKYAQIVGAFEDALARSLPYLDASNLNAGPDMDVFELLLDIDDKNHLRVTPVGTAGRICVGDQTSQPLEHLLTIPNNRTSELLDRTTLDEYQELLNAESVGELEFQRFFETHPEYLTSLGDYLQVRAQIGFVGSNGLGFRPDFMLLPRTSSYVDLVELKHPLFTIATDTRGRRARASWRVRDGIAQLAEYRRFFNDRENRLAFAKRYGIRGYEPKMMLIIGRDRSLSKYDLDTLAEEIPDNLELLTYDAVAARAEKYALMATRFDQAQLDRTSGYNHRRS